MTIFQSFMLIVLAVIVGKTCLRLYRREINLALALIWLLLWAGVTGIVIYPNVINRLADFAGVGRGVDLIIYLSLIAIFYLFFKITVKVNVLDRKITAVVRHLAISNPKKTVKKQP